MSLPYENRMMLQAIKTVRRKYGPAAKELLGDNLFYAALKAEVLAIIAMNDGLQDHPVIRLASLAMRHAADDE
jgi:hypothetical protein